MEFVRLSIGTAIALGLESGPALNPFKTAFLMTFNEDGCLGNCAFCSQARESTSKQEMLSRIGWPKYPLERVMERLSPSLALDRICIQCLNYHSVVEDTLEIIARTKRLVPFPLSICIPPVSKENMIRLRKAGAQNIGLAFDASTPEIFEQVKGKGAGGPYRWDEHIEAVNAALSVFGDHHVTTHLIVGLGESEREAAEFLFAMHNLHVNVGLFAFTNVKGTELERRVQPNLGTYRRIQVLRFLISKELITKDQVSYTHGRLTLGLPSSSLREHLSSGAAFRVSGCPGCNRPYYNERPRGIMYNYFNALTESEIERVLHESELF